MAHSVQIVFDTVDPDRLAKFYATVLGYEMQDPPQGYVSWEAFLEAQGVPKAEWNSASAIVDPSGRGPRIYFQQMDTPKLHKNRVHVDVNASGGSKVPVEDRRKQVDSEVERLLAAGATKQRAWEELGDYWVVMQDPDGNEFCVQ